MKTVTGGVTAAAGFEASGMWCGIKRSGKPDLCLIVAEEPCPAAGVFTRNSVQAAPVLVSKKHLKSGKARAVICNSGNANCFTGDFGLIYAEQMAKATAAALGAKTKEIIVASTGIIGKPLPIKKILTALPVLGRKISRTGARLAARGILTTDLTIKECAVQVTIGRKTVTVGGCAKGSGMIEPNMATMLGFITTDAAITPALLKEALRAAVEPTFNAITVDGCMSTNDMVSVMASGKAGNPTISKKGRDYQTFLEALQFVCFDLARKIVLDGEGATKFISITIDGAKNQPEAKRAALAVANSNLVKTAAYGNNPNWGRVAAAIGSLGLAGVNEKHLKLDFSSFKKRDISIRADLGRGKASATVYTCDLSPEYVKINGKYN